MRSSGYLTVFFVLTYAVAAHATANGRVRDPYNKQATRLPATALLSATVQHKKGPYARQYLSLAQYNDIREGTLEILRRYPAKTHFYMPVGRSPTAIAAFLENLSAEGTELAATIPASGLRKGVTTGHEAAWFKHLDRFIPASVLSGEQRIVLIDRSTTGATLQKMQVILQQYLAARGSTTGVDVVAFSRKQVPFDYVDVTNNAELLGMNRDAYVPWAEWPQFEVGVTPVNHLQVQPGYKTFKAKLLERMAQDHELSAALKQLNLSEE